MIVDQQKHVVVSLGDKLFGEGDCEVGPEMQNVHQVNCDFLQLTVLLMMLYVMILHFIAISKQVQLSAPSLKLKILQQNKE